jgi:hypothetical protein
VKRKTLIAALGCALLATGLVGCGATNKLQTITLTAGGGSGFFDVKGEGGTLQLKATGNYSNSKTRDLTNSVIYTITPSEGSLDAFGFALSNPPLTVTLSGTGLVTAVEPFTCTWVDMEPDPAKAPAWALSGSYKVTATFQGVTSQPVFVGVASSAGNPDNIFTVPPLVGNNPTGQCGP